MSACPSGKVSHPDEWTAAAQALGVAKAGKTSSHLNVYECPKCGGWHWGNAVMRERHRRPASRAMDQRGEGE